MTDMELAEELDQLRNQLVMNRGLHTDDHQKFCTRLGEIIAALRRGHERLPLGEMVMVPRELIDRALLWFHTLAENGMDATFSDGERTPNAVAMDDIAAQFSALKDRA